MRSSKPIILAPSSEPPALDDDLRAKVQASVKDPRPSVPAADVFKRQRARHARTMKTDKQRAK
ncbi:hypothetical protein [Bradyrhizobium sp. SZCCHNS2006]|uniref:antitoxin PaaA2 family protein n=1 Tax=unclassified Bradyrhizobium TaxID=2631580 RepID=UPI00396716CA